MKSTGVIRRIDELGRIVLPKEIRRNLGIREGENLEIFVEEDKMILKKFSKIKDYEEIIKSIGEIVANIYDHKIIVTDREKVIYSNIENIESVSLDKNLINFIQNRESVLKNSLQAYHFNEELKGYYFIMPIITSTDCLGLVLIYSEKELKEENINLLKLVTVLISSKIDIA
ncbi:MAG: AbrB/MazE/SpoVT family DNA-binding domain-containing protein [Bacilli bacterium]|nr:AbrB/MazE/SpoVT family DNA-binding domain-containing protein [Bacilli bacterium]